MVSSGTAVKRRLTHDERRSSLLAAGARVFAARGYAATSVDDIVAEAGVTPPVLYLHFASKRELYMTLLEVHTDELIRRVGEAVRGVRPGRARLRASFDAFFALVEAEPFTLRMISGEDGGDPEIAAAVRRRDRQGRAGVAAILDTGGRLLADVPDRDRSVEMIAQMLRHGLNGLALWWRDHPDVPRDELVDRAMDLAWTGIRSLRGGQRRAER